MKKTIRIVAVAMLAVMLCLTLASCGGPNKDPKKAEAALKEAGYTVSLSELDEADDDGTVAFVSAYKGLTDSITIVYYKDSASAKAAFEEAEKEFAEMKEELGELAENYVCKRSGKIVYMGTKDAVKAAK